MFNLCASIRKNNSIRRCRTYLCYEVYNKELTRATCTSEYKYRDTDSTGIRYDNASTLVINIEHTCIALKPGIHVSTDCNAPSQVSATRTHTRNDLQLNWPVRPHRQKN